MSARLPNIRMGGEGDGGVTHDVAVHPSTLAVVHHPELFVIRGPVSIPHLTVVVHLGTVRWVLRREGVRPDAALEPVLLARVLDEDGGLAEI